MLRAISQEALGYYPKVGGGEDSVVSQLNDRLRQKFDAKQSMIFLLASKFSCLVALDGPSSLEVKRPNPPPPPPKNT